MIVTDDDDIAEEARVYRDQGKGSFHANFHTRMGANWRMSEPHAAIVLSQLHRLDEFIERRQVLAARYDAALASLDLGTLAIPESASSNFYKYVAFLPDGIDRTLFKQHLRSEFDIGLSGEVYDTPLHHQPIFSQLDDRALPGAEWLCARHVCLPLYPALVRGRRRLRRGVARDGTRARRRCARSRSDRITAELTDAGRMSDTSRSPSPAARGSSVRTWSTRCSARATRAGARPTAAAADRTPSGPRSTSSTRTRSPTRSRAAARCSTSRPWPT